MLAEIIPVLLLASVAGAVVDRLPRVQVMVVADLAHAGLAFTLPFVDGHLAWVYATAVGLSAWAVFAAPPPKRCSRPDEIELRRAAKEIQRRGQDVLVCQIIETAPITTP